MAFLNDATRNALASQLRIRIQEMIRSADHGAATISRTLEDRNGRDNSGAFQIGAPTSKVGSGFATFGGPFGPTGVGP